jgi:hypothetical protein
LGDIGKFGKFSKFSNQETLPKSRVEYSILINDLCIFLDGCGRYFAQSKFVHQRANQGNRA